MDPLVTAALIKGGFDIGSSLLGGIGNYLNQKDQQEYSALQNRLAREHQSKENRLSRMLNAYAAEQQKALRDASVANSLLGVLSDSDRKRFLDTSIGTISRR